MLRFPYACSSNAGEAFNCAAVIFLSAKYPWIIELNTSGPTCTDTEGDATAYEGLGNGSASWSTTVFTFIATLRSAALAPAGGLIAEVEASASDRTFGGDPGDDVGSAATSGTVFVFEVKLATVATVLLLDDDELLDELLLLLDELDEELDEELEWELDDEDELEDEEDDELEDDDA
jgi:hypothetical protein